MSIMWTAKFSFVLLVLTTVVRPQSPAKNTQTEDVELHGIGHVRIAVEEPENGWLKMQFTDLATNRTLTTIFSDTSDDSFRANSLSSMRFRLIHVAGFPDPMILGVVMGTGASDCGYQIIPIGIVRGTIRNLSPQILYFATQGGIYLGKIAGSPGLSVWYVQSANDPEHYGSHRYRFQFFRWNPKTGLLESVYVKISRRYDSEREAAESFGLTPTGIIDAVTISSWFPEFGC
jgi:hypothetical protein